MLGAAVMSTEDTTGFETTLADLSFFVNTAEGVAVNDADVVIADIRTTNGVIHVIDSVLLPADIPTLASYSPSFSTVLTAVETAGLGETLATADGITVFAPTDDAFAALPEGTVTDLLADIPALTSVLTYHVLGAAVMSTDVTTGWVSTFGGLSAFAMVDEGVMINDSNVVVADVKATNGVIHAIDAVLLPADVPTLVGYDPSLSTLLTAVVTAELADDLADAEAITVFAPTDDAFAALPDGTLGALLGDIPALSEILLYHVLGASVEAADVTTGWPLTLADLSLFARVAVESTVEGETRSVFVNGATVTTADIVGTNGVIHVIDTVLLPSDIPTLVSYSPGLSTLFAAVGAAGLGGALAGEGPLTLFAPNNAAFDALPAGVLTSLLEDIPALTNVLTYHVFNGAVDSTAAVAAIGSSIEMLNGDDAAITDGPLAIGGAPIMTVDIKATNGIIHTLTGVMLPPT